MIFILLGLLLIAGMVQYYSLEHGQDNLLYQMKLGKHTVEPAEVFEIQTTVENRKWLMISYLCIREKIPQLLMLQDERGWEKEGIVNLNAHLVAECYLAGWQKAEFVRTAYIGERGWYGFYGASLQVGDFLGIMGKTIECGRAHEIVVKPRPVSCPDLDKALGGFLGEVSVRRFWMEDPMYLMGYRDYTGREPMKSISWKMTAKNNRLMVKELDHTAEMSCTVLLDISCKDYWSQNQDGVEQCFSITRTVCEWLEAQGFTYGLMTNAGIAGSAGYVNETYQGRGAAHLEGILESLGRSTYYFTEKLSGMLHRLSAGRTPGRACIIVSLEEAHPRHRMVERIKELSGCEVLILKPDILHDKQEGGKQDYGSASA